MNILVVTPYYPVLNNTKLNNQTQVVHYFTKYWAKRGHKVLVIHTYPHELPDTLNLPRVLSSLSVKKAKIQEIDEVKVAMIEWYRWAPASFKLLKRQERNTISFTIDAVRQWGITPDRIICHFPAACIWLMKALKEEYGCPQIGTFHTSDINLMKRQSSFYLAEYQQVYSSLAFRSINLLGDFKKINTFEKTKFIANSGIPEEILQSNPKKYSSKKSIISLIFVGRLIKRKNVETILYSLSKLENKIDFKFTIIGEGPNEKFLKDLTHELKLEEKVKFTGNLNRQEVFKELKKSDIFIMLSLKETLGLVYLEAMACGCIVIGSVGTGVDGIVTDGENGFLVDSYDQNELCNKLEAIDSMDLPEINKLLINTFNTINNYTDEKMADQYLSNIINVEC